MILLFWITRHMRPVKEEAEDDLGDDDDADEDKCPMLAAVFCDGACGQL